jgi:hypothetical protein
MKSYYSFFRFWTFVILLFLSSPNSYSQNYIIVDTNQNTCFNNSTTITAPNPGQAFYGQDAQYNGKQPKYQNNGDGTITDLVTGLMWQKSLANDKYTYDECVAYAENSTLAGYSDWRLPTIKELYSLILFSGKTGMSETSSIPYLDTDYFDFRFGGTVNPSERFIDAQYATSTIYKGTTMNGNETMFGVNFVDGRIKGYPTFKDFEIKMVRGKSDYGINDFVDNEDGTITDKATGLMWDKTGSSQGMDWEEALASVQQKNEENYLGHNDWRLPNAKELQSIVDYSRSPSATNSAAISPIFDVQTITNESGETDYPFYWTSTTHWDGPNAGKAVYVCFGEALGYMRNSWMDVHGAGAQRSDPKTGNPDDYPYGFGPQGDAIRIYNYARLVRDANINTGLEEKKKVQSGIPIDFRLKQNYPNPFSAGSGSAFGGNPETTISFAVPKADKVSLKIYNVLGENVGTIVEDFLAAGNYNYKWQASRLPGGLYYYTLKSGFFSETKKMLLVR